MGDEGHLTRVLCGTFTNGQCVLSVNAGDNNSGVLFQLLPIPGPVCIIYWFLQLHTEDHSIANRHHCPPRQLFSDIA